MSINLAMWNIKDALFRVVNVLIDTGDTSTRARVSSSAVTDHLAAQTSAGQVVSNDTVGTLRSRVALAVGLGRGEADSEVHCETVLAGQAETCGGVDVKTVCQSALSCPQEVALIATHTHA